jgi:hypothetical protein
MALADGGGGGTTSGGTSTESSGESSTSEDSTDSEESDDDGGGGITGWFASAVKAGKYAKKGMDAVQSGQNAATASRTASKMCSFSGRTKVVMADGSRKAISKVAVGDKAEARDPQTGERTGKAVLALFVHTDRLVELRVGDETITTTADHPFWNAEAGEYQRADELDRGDRVLGTDGRLLKVHGLRAGSVRAGTAYNLEVADIHTYQVGGAGVLVHNTCSVGGAGPVRMGQAGEAAVRSQYNIGPKQAFTQNGNDRIADGMTATRMSEVKNVKSQSYTQQLRDNVDYAQRTGRQVDLYVRPNGGTTLSGPLQDAIADPTVPLNLRFIP